MTDSKQKAFKTHPKVNLLSKEIFSMMFCGSYSAKNPDMLQQIKSIFLLPLANKDRKAFFERSLKFG